MRRFSEDVTQLWNKSNGRKIFSDLISYNSFQSILHVLRLDDAEKKRTKKKSDKIASIRKYFQLYNTYMQDDYMLCAPN